LQQRLPEEMLLEDAKTILFEQKLREVEADCVNELASIQAEMQRRIWLRDPDRWAEERLKDHLWSRQRDVLRSVRDNRKTAVKSCHDVGKSFIASRAVSWWLDTNPPGEAFVVTTAPTFKQVAAVLWREIGRAHVKGSLRGRVNQTEWYMRMPAGNEELVAFGRKPSDYDPTAFQGIHALRVLVVGDEACGLPQLLLDAADSLIANDHGKLLLIGNPDDPTTPFRECCKPGSGFHVIKIGAFDSPNFTGEHLPKHVLDQLIGRLYVEERRKKWAPTWSWTEDGKRVVPPAGADPVTADAHPFWHSKVLGEFPEMSGDTNLIPLAWITAAQERTLPADGERRLGLDVGGGGDESTCCEVQGPVARILWSDNNPDTMQTCGRLLATLEERNASEANVDYIGIGTGLVNRAQELKKPVHGIVVSEAAGDPDHYINLRAEGYWSLREAFEQGLIDLDPEDEDTAAELVNIKYKRTSDGRIQIESKIEYKKRMHGRSPNRADAFMLARLKVISYSATW
jgi:hypothetical protein